jgi:hypothetical protein
MRVQGTQLAVRVQEMVIRGVNPAFFSVMVTALNDCEGFFFELVHKAVFPINSSGPISRPVVF